jgi:hypothetical protein
MGCRKNREKRVTGNRSFMSESTNPPNAILVPDRYLPGNSRRFFDDFFEMAIGPMPPPPALEDGSPLGLAKYYLVACCPVAGSYSLSDGLINLIVDCADAMATQSDKDIFSGRQKAPVGASHERGCHARIRTSEEGFCIVILGDAI